MKIELNQIINWVLTIMLIIAIVFAIRQGYFEERKCVKWVNGRIFNIRTGNPDLSYDCTMQCNSSQGNSFVASSMQQANELNINGENLK